MNCRVWTLLEHMCYVFKLNSELEIIKGLWLEKSPSVVKQVGSAVNFSIVCDIKEQRGKKKKQ